MAFSPSKLTSCLFSNHFLVWYLIYNELLNELPNGINPDLIGTRLKCKTTFLDKKIWQRFLNIFCDKRQILPRNALFLFNTSSYSTFSLTQLLVIFPIAETIRETFSDDFTLFVHFFEILRSTFFGLN